MFMLMFACLIIYENGKQYDDDDGDGSDAALYNKEREGERGVEVDFDTTVDESQSLYRFFYFVSKKKK